MQPIALEPAPTGMSYRNIQGMRAIAALMVVACHMFWNIVPMRTHWAKPFFANVGPAGVDIFFVISGFIIFHVMQRSMASMDTIGKRTAVATFALKRFIRIYPLYWIVFGVACLIMAWGPPMALPRQRPLFLLLTLIDSYPNFRVSVAWTLTFEIYFYAVAGLSLLLLAKRAMIGMTVWFGVIAAATLWGMWRPWAEPLDYAFAPLLLEFMLGMALGVLVDRGFRRFPRTSLVIAFAWMAGGTQFLIPNPGSFPLHVVCWGVPAALFIYGLVVLEVQKQWIMPGALQYLGDASFSLYLWHQVVFNAVSGMYIRLGWVGRVSSTGLTVVMVVLALGAGLLSYHYLEKPLLRVLGQRILGRDVPRTAAVTATLTG